MILMFKKREQARLTCSLPFRNHHFIMVFSEEKLKTEKSIIIIISLLIILFFSVFISCPLKIK